MNIEKNLENDNLIVKVSGKLDITSAHELEKEVNENISGVKEVNLDFKDLDYISSAGIRVILTIKQIMEKQGKLVISNVTPFVMNVFETTGVDKLLNIG